MREAEASDEQVIQAGDELVKEGRTVTGYALRKKLGGGSGSRLARVWSEHLRSRARDDRAALPDLPVEVEEQLNATTVEVTTRLTQLAKALNDTAVKTAERRVAELVRAAGEQKQQAERELADADQAVEELQEALTSARSQLEAANQRLRDLEAEAKREAVDKAALEQRLTTAESDVARLRSENAQLTSSRDEAAELRGENKTLRRQNEQLVAALGRRDDKA